MRNLRSKIPTLATFFHVCQILSMQRFGIWLSIVAAMGLMSLIAFAQTSTEEKSDAVTIEELSKKIDLQNAKIDALSQQILKLEQHLSSFRPGVMIGETPAPATTTSEAPKPIQTGNSHVVAKGETLTSIARMHKVSVEDLQKTNHIENDRKLQIGQTIIIPTATGGAPTPSPTP